MKPSEILIAAKKLIDSTEKWTRSVFARNSEGKEVDTHDPQASCFCSVGALKSVDKGRMTTNYMVARSYLGKAMAEAAKDDDIILIEYNDTHTHEEVMACFDKAIQLALTDEQLTPNT